MAQAKTPTVRKPKFEAKQTQRTKPIGKPTRKEFASPTITEAALDRRRLLSSAPLLTLLGAVSFPLAEAAAAESQASETHLAEVPLASGVTLTVERSGQVALFGINRPQIQNRLDPTTFRALATAYYDYDHDPSLRAAVLFGHGEHFSRGIRYRRIQVAPRRPATVDPRPGDNRPAREAATIPLQAPRRRSPWRHLEHGGRAVPGRRHSKSLRPTPTSARTRTPMAAFRAAARRSALCGKPVGPTRCATS